MTGSLVLTSDVVNYLVYRYLQESGFTHSAFTFGHESSVTRTQVDPNNVPTGSLIQFVQKGLQYLELEANLEGQDEEKPPEFALLTAEELLKNDIDELQRLIQQRRETQAEIRKESHINSHVKSGDDTPAPVEIPDSNVATLHGHESEVYICAWSPTEPYLASGSGDGTARIWNLTSSATTSKPVILAHEVKKDRSRDVTTLDWNQDGSLLATGSYDGVARIWSKDGKLRNTLDKHQGPIFSLKWNKRGDLLLSGSVDSSAIVWDAKTGEPKQTFQLHTAPTLDVDWRNSTSFATCSTDKMIHVCRMGEAKPIKSFAGHEDEVNAIKWDPSGRLLASCSDDHSAKVWSMNSDKPVHDFQEHQREIYTIKWSPTGQGSQNPNLPLLLASASFDTTVRLWDVEQGRCIYCLERHVEPVYSVAFSPNGRYVATGSFDRRLYVWTVDGGQLVRTYKGDAGIYEVCWDKDSSRVAACFANRTVRVVDLRL